MKQESRIISFVRTLVHVSFDVPYLFFSRSLRMDWGERRGRVLLLAFVDGIESFVLHPSWLRLAPDICCLPPSENIFCPFAQEECFWVVCVLSLFFLPLKHRSPMSSNAIVFPPCYKAWNFSPDKAGAILVSPHLFPFSQWSRSFIAWSPMAWDCCFCLFWVVSC